MSASLTPSKQSLTASKVPELKALCTKLHLPTSGNKSDLINRIVAHYAATQLSPANPEPTSNPTSFAGTVNAALPKNDHLTQIIVPHSQQHASDSKPVPAPANQHQTPPIKVSVDTDVIEAEIARRKQRAERFGIEPTKSTVLLQTTEAEQNKKLERAKKFGLPLIDPVSASTILSLDKPLQANPGKSPTTLVTGDSEWEARKRKRAEKFGLVDQQTSDGRNRKPKFYRSRY